MKIYNEVVYQIVDDKLVKVSEDSFDYKGKIALCKSGGGTMGKVQSKLSDAFISDRDKEAWENKTSVYSEKTGTYLTDRATGNNLDKPGGDVKSQVTDVVKDWSGKLEQIAWGDDSTETDEEEVVETVTDPELEDPDYLSSDSDAVANLKANRQKQVQMRGRQAANQTQGQSASMLTA
tara:strand:- start:6094 stop:6627 length:534 start_codon:yes stop_codon:yes gene_type:complete